MVTAYFYRFIPVVDLKECVALPVYIPPQKEPAVTYQHAIEQSGPLYISIYIYFMTLYHTKIQAFWGTKPFRS
jgi:hypothetical protein